MPRRIRWGILSTAKIAVKKVIPAMQQSEWVEIGAIASRDHAKAQQAAKDLNISRAYGSYEELIADPDLDAIYNPLPNHLHAPLSMQAALAGKHVLCEKPLALNVAEAKKLLEAQQRTGVVIAEAFMIRNHPQWQRTREWIAAGRVGKLRAIQGCFSYFNTEPANIRNFPEYGGGGLMDIGCYLIHTSRWLFGEEPLQVLALMEMDPALRVDQLTAAILAFPSGQATFTSSMQTVYHQRMQILGTKGRIQLRAPFTPLPHLGAQILFDDGAGGDPQVEAFAASNQFTLQADAFCRAVCEGSAAPVPLEDSIRNLAVIEALTRSATSGRWEAPQA